LTADSRDDVVRLPKRARTPGDTDEARPRPGEPSSPLSREQAAAISLLIAAYRQPAGPAEDSGAVIS
jgi:hypothetical protein